MSKSFILLLIIALSVTGNDAMANPEDSTQTAYNAALKAPVLVIHGTSDSNVPYSSALLFEQQMIKAGNNITFHPIKGATHFIWFDPQTIDEVNNTRIQFLQKWGY